MRVETYAGGEVRRAFEEEADAAMARRRCKAHLRDLVRAYGRPPRDVPLKMLSVPLRFAGSEFSSGCTSAAGLCAEDGK